MTRGSENTILGKSVSNLIFLDDDFFLQYFDGVKSLRGFFAAQDDLTKCPFAKNFDELKIFQCLQHEK